MSKSVENYAANCQHIWTKITCLCISGVKKGTNRLTCGKALLIVFDSYLLNDLQLTIISRNASSLFSFSSSLHCHIKHTKRILFKWIDLLHIYYKLYDELHIKSYRFPMQLLNFVIKLQKAICFTLIVSLFTQLRFIPYQYSMWFKIWHL